MDVRGDRRRAGTATPPRAHTFGTARRRKNHSASPTIKIEKITPTLCAAPRADRGIRRSVEI
jgi:hypothetical protein